MDQLVFIHLEAAEFYAVLKSIMLKMVDNSQLAKINVVSNHFRKFIWQA